MLANTTKFFRRAMAAIAAVVFFMALAAVPALAQEPPCTPGTIVDFCSDIPPGHGFLLDKGVFTKLDVPDASFTAIYDINNRGQMVGPYVDARGGVQGFLMDKDGVVSAIDHPDAPPPPIGGTGPLSINERGQIVGVFR